MCTCCDCFATVVQMLLSNRGRRDAHKIAIFMSDGHSNINHHNTIPNAIELRQTGCIVLVFAIGTHLGWAELVGIASDPHNHTVFHVTSYNQLSAMLNTMRNATTDGKLSPQ